MQLQALPALPTLSTLVRLEDPDWDISLHALHQRIFSEIQPSLLAA